MTKAPPSSNTTSIGLRIVSFELQQSSTVPEAFYFTIFPFVQRSFSVRSAFVQRSLTVYIAFVQRSFTVHNAFTVHNHSDLQCERTYFYREKMKKGRICKIGRKIKHKSARFYFHRYSTTKTSEGHQLVTTRQNMLNFFNPYEKTYSIVDQRKGDLLPINSRSLGSC
jgi:hypothetical protein